MSPRRSVLINASFIALGTCLIILGTIGGCPVAQQPTTPTQDEDQTPTTPTEDNITRPSRPIPPPPIETPEEGQDTGGSTGGTTGDTGGSSSGSNQAISIVITAPQDADINILPGKSTSISYEVFGGNPSDGAITTTLFFDLDGIENTEDEVTLATNLAPRGTQDFLPTVNGENLAPGVYFLGLRASNTRFTTTVYAGGRLVIVGLPTITLVQPSSDQRVRRNTGVAVQFTINSLATTVSYQVSADPDTAVNGNEIFAFSGGGLSGTGSIFTENYARGRYNILVQISDSTGQDIPPAYLRDPVGALRTITVDDAPTITVTKPVESRIVIPGEKVLVEARIADPEASAAIQLFRDADASFNGNEFVFAEFTLTEAEQVVSAELDTTGLPAGTYRLGGSVSDGVGKPIPGYAPGTIRINAAPTVDVTDPSKDVQIRAGQVVTLRWKSKDFENRLDKLEILVSPDQDGDRVPDIPFDDPSTIVATFTGSEARTRTSYDLDTSDLVGRVMAAVRVTDDVGSSAIDVADGEIDILNDPPTVEILDPTDSIGLREDDSIYVYFTVGDRERALRSQTDDPPGIQIVLARDNDQDGEADGDPIFSIVSLGFHSGANLYPLASDELIGQDGTDGLPLIDENGNGYFKLGVRAQDQADNVTTEFVDGTFSVDLVEPVIEVLAPVFQKNPHSRDKLGSLDVTVRVTDTSRTNVTLILDPDLVPLQDRGACCFGRDCDVRTQWDCVKRGGDYYGDRSTCLDTFNCAADPPDVPEPDEVTIVENETVEAGVQERTFSLPLEDVRAGVYFIYVMVQDSVLPAVAFYAPSEDADQQVPEELTRIHVRDRLIGSVRVSSFDNSKDGAVLRGFNVNDLAGGAMTRVPDVNGDDLDEFLITSRYGKAYLIGLDQGSETYGFGEAYMAYGSRTRLSGINTLNAVSKGIPGLIFAGIRVPLIGGREKTWIGTDGIADATFVRDIDGDEIPEIVFAFPRVESLNLGVDDVRVQDPSLLPDIPDMGSLEYNAWDPVFAVWTKDVAQFTRGGVVIVSSHNSIITDPGARNRKSDRVLDLHEVGQMFNSMSRPSLIPFIDRLTLAFPDELPKYGYGSKKNKNRTANPSCETCGGEGCDNDYDAEIIWYKVNWDVAFNNQGPGGFHQPWTDPPASPGLANPGSFPWAPCALLPPPWDQIGYQPPTYYDPTIPPCPCGWINAWLNWEAVTGTVFPCTNGDYQGVITNSWCVESASVWTGFYGPDTSIRDSSVGARVFGQNVNNRFAASVASDNTWLYMAAPDMKALKIDVPALGSPQAGGDRADAGVIHQMRVDVRARAGEPNKAQLWLEPGKVWPDIDVELSRTDYTMPVPHQYIIESMGSLRGYSGGLVDRNFSNGGCLPNYNAGSTGASADACFGYTPYPVDTAGYVVQHNPQQIVGPHISAKVRFVRALGDVNGDGVRDFAVGTESLKQNFNNTDPTKDGSPLKPTGDVVGGVFIVFGRPEGVQGDYLLERLAYDKNSLQRLNGFLIKGAAKTAVIGKAFDTAGDFNGDGVDDVIIGSENTASGDGEVTVVLGTTSDTLISPAGGWTFDDSGNFDQRGVRFKGVGGSAGKAGAMVTTAGDVDGDGYSDVLIAAPALADPDDSNKQPGVVYLIYGSAEYNPTPFDDNGDGKPDRYEAKSFNLADVGTPTVPGVVFVGRNNGDKLGAGDVLVKNASPSGQKDITVLSRGMATIGDIDGDGLQDYALSAMVAAPNDKQRAGEIYIIYGKGDRVR
jgi:hypothetical protein